MSKDILEILGRERPPELDNLGSIPVNPTSALRDALGSSEYWYQKYCGLEKEILDSGLRDKKVKRINGLLVYALFFISLFGLYNAYYVIQYRHKAEALQSLLEQTLLQLPLPPSQ